VPQYIEDKHSSKRSSFLQVVKSVLAAALGVQSQKNLEHDGQQNGVAPYIVVAVLVVVLFVLTLIGVVALVVRYAS